VSDLTAFRDHCRTMADPNAWAGAHRHPRVLSWPCDPRSDGTAGHGECEWGWQGCACEHHDADRPKPPTPAERTLWTHLADEIDRWLKTGLDNAAPDAHTEPLWETP
jgi:hypothetical protein